MTDRTPLRAPSLSALAADAIRSMILGGQLQPGDRIVENRVATRLGISRPPLREALRRLQQEGLVVQEPRQGATVTPLSQHDVFEIVTLREEIERMAIRFGVPVRSERLLVPCRESLEALAGAAASGDEGDVTTQTFAFHLAIIGLAENQRLTEMYRSLSLQIQLCMSMNRGIRREVESLAENVARHRSLLAVVESGDPEAAHAAFADHGHRSFLKAVADRLDGASQRSRAWLAGS